MKTLLDRRRFLGGLAAASTLPLSGCFDPLVASDSEVRGILESANTLTYKAQRLLLGSDHLAREFDRSEIRQPMRPNGSTNPQDEPYLALSPATASRTTGSPSPAPCAPRRCAVACRPAGDACAYADHAARLRGGLELHRGMDRHAARSRARSGRRRALGALCRLPLLRTLDNVSRDRSAITNRSISSTHGIRRRSSPMG